MKANLIKQLHAIGVYRDPKTKQKLECMKMTAILEVLNWVEEEMSNGRRFERSYCEYEFVTPKTKAEKLLNKGKKKK